MQTEPDLTEEQRFLRRRGLMIGGGVLLLVASFLVGVLINRDGAPKNAPVPLEEQAARQNPSAPLRADTPLVPAGTGGIEQPITSAPVTTTDGSALAEYQRTDATAVSALEYAQMEKRARAEQARNPSFVDPRSLTGPAYAQHAPLPPRRTAARPPVHPADAATQAPAQPVRVARTRPVPQYQPIPPMRGRGTARLSLTVGPDGNVKEINVERALEGGNTAALLAAVQRWRFKPAMENGSPVSAPYSVDISFKR